MKDKPLIIAVVVIVVGLLAYLGSQLEYYEEEVDSGWSLAAAFNSFLGAEKFLSRVGHEVESNYQLDINNSLSRDATLIISNPNHVLDERRADSLVEWMENGGHIIVAPLNYFGVSQDVFLDRFGVEKYSYRTDLYPDGEPEGEKAELTLADRIRENNRIIAEEERKQKNREQAKEQGLLDNVTEEIEYDESLVDQENVVIFELESHRDKFRILLDTGYYLDHPALYEGDDSFYEGYRPVFWQGSDTGITFMQFEINDGLLTVLSDGTIWDNKRIGWFDHAYLLEILTEDSDSIIFLRGAIVPGFFELIWQYYRELCVSLILILALWLIYRARRFGAVHDGSYRGRRSYQEHLAAVGNFYWRHKQYEELLDNARQAVWREFNRKHITAKNENKAQRYQRLAAVTELSVDKLQQIMDGEPPADEFKFYQRIKILQRIRKQL